METTNNNKLGKHKMFTWRKFNLLVKEAPSPGELRSNCKQAGNCWNRDVNKHRAERLKNMMREARTKMPLISQCKETHLYFPDEATRGERAICSSMILPRSPARPGSPWGPAVGAPVQPPSLSAHLNHHLAAQR